MATDTTAPTQSDGEVIAHMLAGFGGGGARGRGVVRVGHWTDVRARTGVTVVLLPEGSIGSAEVRGGAPATREFDVLAPTATVTRLDAVVLSGGSAFGLGAVDGVVTGLAAAGRGFVTAGGVVPIVAGMSLFDLAVGSPHIRPGATEGALATAAVLGAAATPDTRDGAPATGAVGAGAVGAGAGATVSKWRGRDVAVPGGLVTATICEGGFTVTALVAANAFGDVIGQGPANLPWPNMVPSDLVGSSFGQNTTLGVIVTDAALTTGMPGRSPRHTAGWTATRWWPPPPAPSPRLLPRTPADSARWSSCAGWRCGPPPTPLPRSPRSRLRAPSRGSTRPSEPNCH